MHIMRNILNGAKLALVITAFALPALLLLVPSTTTPLPCDSPLTEPSECRVRAMAPTSPVTTPIAEEHREPFSAGHKAMFVKLYSQLEDLQKLLEGSGTTLTLSTASASVHPHTSENLASFDFTGIPSIVARLSAGPGRNGTLLSAHLDSHYLGQGASDDLVHVLSNVEVLRALAHRAVAGDTSLLSRDLVVAILGEEEFGHFIGSFVLAHPECQRVDTVLNYDSMGRSHVVVARGGAVGKSFVSSLNFRSRLWQSPLMADMFRLVKSSTDFSTYVHGADGADVVLVGDGEIYHTSRDTMATLPRGVPQNVMHGTLHALSESHGGSDTAIVSLGGLFTLSIDHVTSVRHSVAAAGLALGTAFRVRCRREVLTPFVIVFCGLLGNGLVGLVHSISPTFGSTAPHIVIALHCSVSAVVTLLFSPRNRMGRYVASAVLMSALALCMSLYGLHSAVFLRVGACAALLCAVCEGMEWRAASFVIALGGTLAVSNSGSAASIAIAGLQTTNVVGGQFFYSLPMFFVTVVALLLLHPHVTQKRFVAMVCAVSMAVLVALPQRPFTQGIFMLHMEDSSSSATYLRCSGECAHFDELHGLLGGEDVDFPKVSPFALKPVPAIAIPDERICEKPNVSVSVEGDVWTVSVSDAPPRYVLHFSGSLVDSPSHGAGALKHMRSDVARSYEPLVAAVWPTEEFSVAVFSEEAEDVVLRVAPGTESLSLRLYARPLATTSAFETAYKAVKAVGGEPVAKFAVPSPSLAIFDYTLENTE